MSSAEPSRRLALALLAAAVLAAWGGSLLLDAWIRDDRWLLLENSPLRAGALGPLLLGGYWEPAFGEGTPIHQWRPALNLSFLVQVATTGFRPLPLRTVNLLLHLLCAGLLWEALRRRAGGRVALAGALLWSVLPVHAETLGFLTSRSELLAGAAVLGAWLLLGAPERPGRGRLAAGTLAYLLGSLSKEHALLFPLFLALADWTFAGALPWERGRRRAQLALAGAAALVLAGRALLLPAVAAGGHPYFPESLPWLSRLLTLAKFWFAHYLRPALSGSGMCVEYGRPLIPDSGPGDLAAWLCLLALAAGLALALRGLARRRPWSFWTLGPLLFLLPTSQLLMDLDTIGASRFLYLPSIALAWAAGTLLERLRARAPRAALAAAAALLLFYTARARAELRSWGSAESLHRAALACNPDSARARAALGAALLEAGKEAEGEAFLLSALEAQPRHYPAAYNLALLAYRRGQHGLAQDRLGRALTLRPTAPDGLALAGLLAEKRGRWDEAARAYAQAAELRPHDPAPRYNLARALARLGRTREAGAQLDAYLRGAPDDDAARRWRESLP